MIEVENIFKEYSISKNKVSALKDINFKIEDGEFVGILGSSGSGKTTLSNIIAGLLAPSSGSVKINGVSLWDLKDKEISEFRNKKLGFVFQSFNLIPELNAVQNVMLPLAYSKVKYKERMVRGIEALKKVGLENRIYHKPYEMSGGQMQRVSVARAIINNPEIIIADEPTGNLDSNSADTIMSILNDINKTGVTILMVTHNLAYRDYFSTIINIKDGIIDNIEKK